MTITHLFDPQFFTSDKQWKISLSLAISVHLLVFVLLIMPPIYQRDFMEIQTIDLFTADEVPELNEPAPRVEQPPKAAEPKPEPPKPEPIKEEIVSTVVEPLPPIAAKPVEVVSLRPRKLKKKITPPKDETDELRMKALERIQVKVNQKQEEEKLKHDLAKLRDTIHTSAPKEPATQPSPTPGAAQTKPTASAATGRTSRGSKALHNEALKRYVFSINRKIQNHWALPQTEDWNNLEAIAFIVVRRDGVVKKISFEKKSSNATFDQYVIRTIKASLPLAPFPSDLKDKTLDIGLVFTPSGIQ